ncbi:MAG: universal stress protein [Thermodesulfobacteriales bacterium]|jgi:nucleotide-binding universal stress UspA family protein
MNIKKILWASDGSKESDSALRYATFLAEKFGAEILSIFVSEIYFPVTSLFPIQEDAIMDIVEKTEKRFENRFIRVSKRLKEKGINSTFKIVRDGAVEGIIKAVKSNGCDLIVMGKHGQGFVERAIIGSNTAKVLRKSPVPVLSVKGKGRKSISKIENILVPVDVSDDTESAILSSLELAEIFNASVTLLYVFWLDENVYDIPPSLVKKFIEKSHQKLDQIANLNKKKFLKANKRTKLTLSTEVLHGVSPALAIRYYANKNKIDFIMMNTHGRKGIKRIVLGSEAEKVIREAPCPVLVFRP